jgi:hypothetical protein
MQRMARTRARRKSGTSIHTSHVLYRLSYRVPQSVTQHNNQEQETEPAHVAERGRRPHHGEDAQQLVGDHAEGVERGEEVPIGRARRKPLVIVSHRSHLTCHPPQAAGNPEAITSRAHNIQMRLTLDRWKARGARAEEVEETGRGDRKRQEDGVEPGEEGEVEEAEDAHRYNVEISNS